MALLNITPRQRGDVWGRWNDFPVFGDLQRDLTRLVDDVSRTFEGNALHSMETAFTPMVDVKEEKDEIVATAELPGMTEKEIEVNLTDNSITLKGEKKSEKEEKRKDYYRMERSYGSFERVIALPCEVETNKAEAVFKNGILTVRVPKSAHAKKQVKKLPIKSE